MRTGQYNLYLFKKANAALGVLNLKIWVGIWSLIVLFLIHGILQSTLFWLPSTFPRNTLKQYTRRPFLNLSKIIITIILLKFKTIPFHHPLLHTIHHPLHPLLHTIDYFRHIISIIAIRIIMVVILLVDYLVVLVDLAKLFNNHFLFVFILNFISITHILFKIALLNFMNNKVIFFIWLFCAWYCELLLFFFFFTLLFQLIKLLLKWIREITHTAVFKLAFPDW